MTSEIGLITAQSCVRRWQLDDVTFTYVVDGSMWLAAELFLSAIPSSHWEAHPDEIGADGMVAMSAGGLLIETTGMRILVDAGLGDVESEGPLGRNDCGEFLNTLAALGVDPAAIDVFALTHLHVDHTGWAFRQDDNGSRHPTFPCAQYVLGTAEWAPYTRGERPRGSCGHETVIEPLQRLADLKLIADRDEIAPGVTALVTPGHSSGHTSYVVTNVERCQTHRLRGCVPRPRAAQSPGLGLRTRRSTRAGSRRARPPARRTVRTRHLRLRDPLR